MVSHENLQNPEAKFDEVVEGLIFNGYQETDMQYNIARLEGETRTDRIDLVQPETGDRLLVVLGSDQASEDLVRQAMGEKAVLGLRQSSLQGVNTYGVPREAKLLSKVLSVSPYQSGYMGKLRIRHEEVRNTLLDLDPDSFGVSDDSLVIVPNGHNDQDDVHISIVPPLKPQSVMNDISKINSKYNEINRNPAKSRTSEETAQSA